MPSLLSRTGHGGPIEHFVKAVKSVFRIHPKSFSFGNLGIHEFHQCFENSNLLILMV